MKLFKSVKSPINLFEGELHYELVAESSSLEDLKEKGRCLANEVNPKAGTEIQNSHIRYSEVLMGNREINSAAKFYLYANYDITFYIEK